MTPLEQYFQQQGQLLQKLDAMLARNLEKEFVSVEGNVGNANTSTVFNKISTFKLNVITNTNIEISSDIFNHRVRFSFAGFNVATDAQISRWALRVETSFSLSSVDGKALFSPIAPAQTNVFYLFPTYDQAYDSANSRFNFTGVINETLPIRHRHLRLNFVRWTTSGNPTTEVGYLPSNLFSSYSPLIVTFLGE
jgi:hypothetical protein